MECAPSLGPAAFEELAGRVFLLSHADDKLPLRPHIVCVGRDNTVCEKTRTKNPDCYQESTHILTTPVATLNHC